MPAKSISIPPDAPVLAAVPALKKALSAPPRCAVLSAPTASGKTTVMPLALLDMPELSGRKILIAEPRRLAAELAAARLASAFGENPGGEVGCRTRFDNIPGRRIEVVTNGVLLRMLQADPAMDGVGLVVFDEFHERSLAGDMALAFAVDARSALRDDLMLLPASATGESEKISRLLWDAPVIRTDSGGWPVTLRYRADDIKRPLIPSVVNAVLWSLANDPGDILAFLPGEGEIRCCADELAGKVSGDVDIRPLCGRLSRELQEAAILPSPAGRRKVVLSTNVAESSLTIQGIRVVIDSGLEKRPVYDPARDMSALMVKPISASSAEQRAGRAGRTAPGICVRLWSKNFQASLSERKPEILDTDLSGLMLETAAWGVPDPSGLQWLTPPPEGRLKLARSKLIRLGAIDPDTGNITGRGRELSSFGVDPALAEILRLGRHDRLRAAAGCMAAALLAEDGGGAVDFGERCRKSSRRIKELARRFAARTGVTLPAPEETDEFLAAELLVTADRNRLARRRGGRGSREYQMFSGTLVRFREVGVLTNYEYIAVLSASGAGLAAEITLAAPLREEFVTENFSRFVDERLITAVEDGRLRAEKVRMLGNIEIRRMPGGRFTMGEIRKTFCRRLAETGSLAELPLDDNARNHLARARFIAGGTPAIPADAFDDDVLAAAAEEWLGPFIKTDSLADINFAGAIDSRLAALGCFDPEKRAPLRYIFPSGRREKIDYTGETPVLAAALKEFFGMTEHPTAGTPPFKLKLILLSPARRPVQITGDLPGFWKGSYSLVRKEMRAAYPKHNWPDDPAGTPPPSAPRAR